MPPRNEDDTGALEKARERLYKPIDYMGKRNTIVSSGERTMPHSWEEDSLKNIPMHRGKRRVRLAGIFFMIAFVFFIISYFIK